MNNYWEKILYPQFLKGIDSCTLSDLTSYEIQDEIGNLAIRAISDFRFPRVSLEYSYDSDLNPDTSIPLGYYFKEEVTQKEYNVILARMKQYWIEYQISQERLFANAYFDSEIRLHSPGNTIDKLIKLYDTFKKVADDSEYNYYREDRGVPLIGGINV